MLVWTVLIASVLAVGAFLAGQTRASALRVAGGPALHSLPTYHGLFLASGVITGAALAGLAAILLFGTQSIAVPAAAAIGAAGTGAALYPRIASAFRARNLFERFVLAVLVLCSAVAVLTTIGIVFSVVFETIIFFRQVSPCRIPVLGAMVAHLDAGVLRHPAPAGGDTAHHLHRHPGCRPAGSALRHLHGGICLRAACAAC